MENKKIHIEQKKSISSRPLGLNDFIGQEDIKNIIRQAVISAQKREDSLGHMLFCGTSGYGKTSLAQIVAREMGSDIHVITAYAINKASDLISILSQIQVNDVVFIDEIHRLKPQLEEVLYTAMEDNVIDMVMPDGGHLRMPVQKFCLIGATTKSESLSEPLKNRFVYKFFFTDYTYDEKLSILKKYIEMYIPKYDSTLLDRMSKKVDSVPREIHNLAIRIRDYLTSHEIGYLDLQTWLLCEIRLNIDDGGITSIHKKYLQIVQSAKGAVGLKTIAVQMGINEESIEQDIEPLLMKLGLIERTPRGRIFVEG